MARFNTAVATRTKTVNLAGGQAFTESPKLELASILLTSFVADQFYKSANDTLARLKALIPLAGAEFAAKAAIYSREKMHLRSITHVTAAEVAAATKGSGAEWKRRFFKRVVERPDDITEILSYYMTNYGKPLPNALKRGLGDAIVGFDEYQIAKYRGEGKGMSLVDAVNLIHPQANEVLGKLVNGTLKSTETWESKLSEAGSDAEAKEGAWRSLLVNRQIGYFALLRNLRNILTQAPELVPNACAQLVDERAIRGSKVLPFRYVTAYRELQKEAGARPILEALDKACEIALGNIPKLPGSTCVILDLSGSMRGKPIEVAAPFAVAVAKSQNADMIVFGGQASYATPVGSILVASSAINPNMGGTDFHAPFGIMKAGYDRLIFLSDMQGWIGNAAPTADLEAYRKKSEKRTKVYSFDCSGYGSLQFPQSDVFALAGVSEKIFDLFEMLEGDRSALVNEIERIAL